MRFFHKILCLIALYKLTETHWLPSTIVNCNTWKSDPRVQKMYSKIERWRILNNCRLINDCSNISLNALHIATTPWYKFKDEQSRSSCFILPTEGIKLNVSRWLVELHCQTDSIHSIHSIHLIDSTHLVDRTHPTDSIHRTDSIHLTHRIHRTDSIH